MPVQLVPRFRISTETFIQLSIPDHDESARDHLEQEISKQEPLVEWDWNWNPGDLHLDAIDDDKDTSEKDIAMAKGIMENDNYQGRESQHSSRSNSKASASSKNNMIKTNNSLDDDTEIQLSINPLSDHDLSSHHRNSSLKISNEASKEYSFQSSKDGSRSSLKISASDILDQNSASSSHSPIANYDNLPSHAWYHKFHPHRKPSKFENTHVPPVHRKASPSWLSTVVSVSAFSSADAVAMVFSNGQVVLVLDKHIIKNQDIELEMTLLENTLDEDHPLHEYGLVLPLELHFNIPPYVRDSKRISEYSGYITTYIDPKLNKATCVKFISSKITNIQNIKVVSSCVVVGYTSGAIAFFSTVTGKLLYLSHVNERDTTSPVVSLQWNPGANNGLLVILSHGLVVYFRNNDIVEYLRVYEDFTELVDRDPPVVIPHTVWNFDFHGSVHDVVMIGKEPPRLCEVQNLGSEVPHPPQQADNMRFLSAGISPTLASVVCKMEHTESTGFAARSTAMAMMSAAGSFFRNAFRQESQLEEKQPHKVFPSYQRNMAPVLMICEWSEPKRAFISIAHGPSASALLAAVDSLGRVSLIDAIDQCIVRVFKGYRNAQVAWLATTPIDDGSRLQSLLVILAPHRHALEVWHPWSKKPVASFRVARDSVLLKTAAPDRLFCIMPSGTIFQIQPDIFQRTSPMTENRTCPPIENTDKTFYQMFVSLIGTDDENKEAFANAIQNIRGVRVLHACLHSLTNTIPSAIHFDCAQIAYEKALKSKEATAKALSIRFYVHKVLADAYGQLYQHYRARDIKFLRMKSVFASKSLYQEKKDEKGISHCPLPTCKQFIEAHEIIYSQHPCGFEVRVSFPRKNPYYFLISHFYLSILESKSAVENELRNFKILMNLDMTPRAVCEIFLDYIISCQDISQSLRKSNPNLDALIKYIIPAFEDLHYFFENTILVKEALTLFQVVKKYEKQSKFKFHPTLEHRLHLLQSLQANIDFDEETIPFLWKYSASFFLEVDEEYDLKREVMLAFLEAGLDKRAMDVMDRIQGKDIAASLAFGVIRKRLAAFLSGLPISTIDKLVSDDIFKWVIQSHQGGEPKGTLQGLKKGLCKFHGYLPSASVESARCLQMVQLIEIISKN